MHLSTSGPPSHRGWEEKSCGCEKGGLRDESFVCTTCCDRCDSLFDAKCSCHSKLFTKADSKELITRNAWGKECPLQKCTYRIEIPGLPSLPMHQYINNQKVLSNEIPGLSSLPTCRCSSSWDPPNWVRAVCNTCKI